MEELTTFFEEFRKEFPETEFILMSSLAEGADRIAALAAIKNGVTVAPVLPVTAKNYEDTFKGFGYNSVEESVTAFRDILDDKEHVLTPCVLSRATSAEKNREAFRRTSAYMISQSHVLIAMWDGYEYDRPGGTYDSIRMAFQGIDHNLQSMNHAMSTFDGPTFTPASYLSVAEDCPIYVIPAERLTEPAELLERGRKTDERSNLPESGFMIPQMTPDMVITKKEKYRRKSGKDCTLREGHIPMHGVPESVQWSKAIPQYYFESFHAINDINKDLILNKKCKEIFDKESLAFTVNRPGENIEIVSVSNTLYAKGSVVDEAISYGTVSKGLLRYDENDDNIIKTILTLEERRALHAMATRFYVADRLAGEYQRKSFVRISISLFLTLMMGFFFQLYILMSSAVLFIGVYALMMLTSMSLYYFHKRSRAYLRFIEYRTLAESVRVNYYWAITGINDSVSSVCYGYMKNEIMWVRNVLKSWNSFFLNVYSTYSDVKNRTEMVEKVWIEDQKRYHTGKFKGVHGKKGNRDKFVRANHLSLAVVLLLFMVSVVTTVLSLPSFSAYAGHITFTFSGLYAGDFILIPPTQMTILVLMKISMMMLVFVSVYLKGYREKLIHGGTPEQIKAKINMFNIAERRLRLIDDTEKSSKLNILYELGVQCIVETNDWAFEHKSKDMSLPSSDAATGNLGS